jgi:arylsulfatase A-like enzyme
MVWSLLGSIPIVLLALLASAEGEKAATRPNLILITIDTLRADHTSLYGYSRDTTPELSKLAAAGTTFEVAYAPASSTGPSHATMFTGKYPTSHGLVKNGTPLAPKQETLAEILSGQGYQTAAVVSSFVLDRRFGLDQGFETYQDDFEAEESTVKLEEWRGHDVPKGFDRRADDATRRATRWLWFERDKERPFFLFVHFFDPHSPYAPPEEFAQHFTLGPALGSKRGAEYAEELRKYDAEIAYTDRELGSLLGAFEAQGLLDDTLVVVTSDHGEGLMDHGVWLHGLDVHEESVRVPLLLRWPGVVPEGKRASEPVALVDLAPTLLDLMSIPHDRESLEGRSLAPYLRGEASLDPNQPVFLHRRWIADTRVDGVEVSGEQFGVRVGGLKLIDHTTDRSDELYDVEADPGETRNLLSRSPDDHQRLSKILESWKLEHVGESGSSRLSEGVRKALEALGYVE